MTKPTPWPSLLSLAQQLCVAPADFWRLSIKEWRALVGTEEVLSRDAFAAMMRRFPDGKHD
jgi:uncharacterized phage protein (TIGR02216 family)